MDRWVILVRYAALVPSVPMYVTISSYEYLRSNTQVPPRVPGRAALSVVFGLCVWVRVRWIVDVVRVWIRVDVYTRASGPTCVRVRLSWWDMERFYLSPVEVSMAKDIQRWRKSNVPDSSYQQNS